MNVLSFPYNYNDYNKPITNKSNSNCSKHNSIHNNNNINTLSTSFNISHTINNTPNKETIIERNNQFIITTFSSLLSETYTTSLQSISNALAIFSNSVILEICKINIETELISFLDNYLSNIIEKHSKDEIYNKLSNSLKEVYLKSSQDFKQAIDALINDIKNNVDSKKNNKVEYYYNNIPDINDYNNSNSNINYKGDSKVNYTNAFSFKEDCNIKNNSKEYSEENKEHCDSGVDIKVNIIDNKEKKLSNNDNANDRDKDVLKTINTVKSVKSSKINKTITTNNHSPNALLNQLQEQLLNNLRKNKIDLKQINKSINYNTNSSNNDLLSKMKIRNFLKGSKYNSKTGNDNNSNDLSNYNLKDIINNNNLETLILKIDKNKSINNINKVSKCRNSNSSNPHNQGAILNIKSQSRKNCESTGVRKQRGVLDFKSNIKNYTSKSTNKDIKDDRDNKPKELSKNLDSVDYIDTNHDNNKDIVDSKNDNANEKNDFTTINRSSYDHVISIIKPSNNLTKANDNNEIIGTRDKALLNNNKSIKKNNYFNKKINYTNMNNTKHSKYDNRYNKTQSINNPKRASSTQLNNRNIKNIYSCISNKTKINNVSNKRESIKRPNSNYKYALKTNTKESPFSFQLKKNKNNNGTNITHYENNNIINKPNFVFKLKPHSCKNKKTNNSFIEKSGVNRNKVIGYPNKTEKAFSPNQFFNNINNEIKSFVSEYYSNNNSSGKKNPHINEGKNINNNSNTYKKVNINGNHLHTINIHNYNNYHNYSNIDNFSPNNNNNNNSNNNEYSVFTKPRNIKTLDHDNYNNNIKFFNRINSPDFHVKFKQKKRNSKEKHEYLFNNISMISKHHNIDKLWKTVSKSLEKSNNNKYNNINNVNYSCNSYNEENYLSSCCSNTNDYMGNYKSTVSHEREVDKDSNPNTNLLSKFNKKSRNTHINTNYNISNSINQNNSITLHKNITTNNNINNFMFKTHLNKNISNLKTNTSNANNKLIKNHVTNISSKLKNTKLVNLNNHRKISNITKNYEYIILNTEPDKRNIKRNNKDINNKNQEHKKNNEKHIDGFMNLQEYQKNNNNNNIKDKANENISNRQDNKLNFTFAFNSIKKNNNMSLKAINKESSDDSNNKKTISNNKLHELGLVSKDNSSNSNVHKNNMFNSSVVMEINNSYNLNIVNSVTEEAVIHTVKNAMGEQFYPFLNFSYDDFYEEDSKNKKSNSNLNTEDY